MGLIEPSGMTGFSNRTAGPPLRSSRVWISVISRWVETGSDTRTSSPAVVGGGSTVRITVPARKGS